MRVDLRIHLKQVPSGGRGLGRVQTLGSVQILVCWRGGRAGASEARRSPRCAALVERRNACGKTVGAGAMRSVDCGVHGVRRIKCIESTTGGPFLM